MTEPRKRYRSTRAESHLVKQCALEHGISDRSVRAWRAQGDPRWQKFVASRTVQRVGALELPALRAAGSVTSPVTEEAFAGQRLVVMQQELDAVIERGESSSVPVLVKAVTECQKLLHICRVNRLEYEERNGTLVKKQAASAFIMRTLGPIQDALKNMPTELGGVCNPQRPDVAIQALESWLFDRLFPRIREALAEVGEDGNPIPPGPDAPISSL
jgi:hypothetical protein